MREVILIHSQVKVGSPRGDQSLNIYAKEGGFLSNLYQQETNVLVSH